MVKPLLSTQQPPQQAEAVSNILIAYHPIFPLPPQWTVLPVGSLTTPYPIITPMFSLI